MQYRDLSDQWRLPFHLAYEAFDAGSLPIGAAVYSIGRGIWRGRNRMTDLMLKGQGRMTAHAEIEALGAIPIPDLEQRLSLYTLMEPCPMCFGAANVARVAELHYVCRDPWAGSTNLAGANWYMQRKAITIVHEGGDFERIMAAWLVYSMMRGKLETGLMDCDNEFVDRWAMVIPDIKKLLPQMADNARLRDVALGDASLYPFDPEDVFNALAEVCGVSS